MILKVQILSLLYSFIYGLVFYYLMKLNKTNLYNNKFSFFIDLLFVVDNVLLYFLILKKINAGIFHIYFSVMIILGYLLGYYIDKKKQV